ncbi:putative Sec-independent-protein-translocase protein TatA/E [Blattabacterium sp. (Blattella germanica) str. Bge]|uniref:Sec-independent protein translocase subunit TatA/TatB n=1 Tax=Blattabacterium sp. (Blattella germanica) TaxID=624186 RepID=UPI0001BB60B4|nr:twin-arginine translocase TatA/TatE family subunit [Blattabacterium sp. (Blattella germanica)]ACY40126.1 putative Sec-independent-protein-translocase protein TatA/E [Blattabacterium sp. (Blattella germanica) str. Bge]
MTNFLFISIEESFFIIFIALLVFGPKKIPDIARGLGEGIRYLKNAKEKIKNEILTQENQEKQTSIPKKEKKPPYSVKR